MDDDDKSSGAVRNDERSHDIRFRCSPVPVPSHMSSNDVLRKAILQH